MASNTVAEHGFSCMSLCHFSSHTTESRRATDRYFKVFTTGTRTASAPSLICSWNKCDQGALLLLKLKPFCVHTEHCKEEQAFHVEGLPRFQTWLKLKRAAEYYMWAQATQQPGLRKWLRCLLWCNYSVSSLMPYFSFDPGYLTSPTFLLCKTKGTSPGLRAAL